MKTLLKLLIAVFFVGVVYADSVRSVIRCYVPVAQDARSFAQARAEALDDAGLVRGDIMRYGQLTYDEDSDMADAIWAVQNANDYQRLNDALATLAYLQQRYGR